MTKPLTIIGSGHAGYTLSKEWRKLAPDAPLRLITRDDGANYYKPNLSKAFASGKDAEGLIISSAAQMAEQLKADIRIRATVTRIAPDEHRLYLGDQALEYSKLVLALGAEVIRLPIAGDATNQLLSVNNREDYARFRATLKPGAQVLIIGAGLIGCEFANDLAAAGFKIHVVDIAQWPLPRLLPEACGRALQNGLSTLGVQWHLQQSVTSLNHDGGAIRAELSGGGVLHADNMLSAVGLRPSLALAQSAGIACKQGILVNELLQTSVADIYALGDCIEISGRVLPYILPIAYGARALAATLAGTPTKAKFPAMPVVVKTPACPTLVNPPPAIAGTWEVNGAAPDLEALFKDANGKPAGFALLGAATAKRGYYTQMMPAVYEPA